ncbi:MAG: aspartyl-phosphate phosphatase Spo0E family protein [Betaproteobacteria bacterium]
MARKDIERLRQKLNRLLDRQDKLNDPEVVRLALQLDRLILEEMRRGLAEDESPEGPALDGNEPH